MRPSLVDSVAVLTTNQADGTFDLVGRNWGDNMIPLSKVVRWVW